MNGATTKDQYSMQIHVPASSYFHYGLSVRHLIPWER